MPRPEPGTVAVSLGRAFAGAQFDAEPVEVDTPYGPATVHRVDDQYVLFRHGRSHELLPHQIPYRAQIAALRMLGVQSLLSTGYVDLITDELPLHQPLLVSDIVMPTGLLPDGTPCTMFTEGPGRYLVVEGGLLSEALATQVRAIATVQGRPLAGSEVEVDHVAGPRGRTAAETRRLAGSGVQAVSMTLLPEIVLANEVGITVASIVVGYRTLSERLGYEAVEHRLAQTRERVEQLCAAFLRNASPVPSTNPLASFGRET
ncbi:MAG: 5'-methylthioadenosine phosphorylase [Alphaproteobacteria bacterium]|nr:5'-methylthioadenosine phosphorylase [Alphaproteobacteria bacterium]